MTLVRRLWRFGDFFLRITGCVRRWRSASGVPPESGLAVALGDDIDILSSGLVIQLQWQEWPKSSSLLIVGPANPLLSYFQILSL